MTAGGTAAGPLQRQIYSAAVIGLYLELPDTPGHANARDRAMAERLFDGRVSMETVETALVLASVRRLLRPPNAASLPRIRSLAYFQPVIEEVLGNPPGPGYLAYLRRKLAALARGVAS